jgi:hypothetical protein
MRSDDRPFLFVALSMVALVLSLPADGLQLAMLSGMGKPAGFGLCSLLLLPATGFLIGADQQRRKTVRRGGLFLMGHAVYALAFGLWLIPFVFLWVDMLIFGDS